MMQMLPYADEKCSALLRGFEQLVYQQFGKFGDGSHSPGLIVSSLNSSMKTLKSGVPSTTTRNRLPDGMRCASTLANGCFL